jgi:hypothetical protein
VYSRLFIYIIDFCKVDGEMQPLWSRVEDYTRELYAMREVFDMDSSVRIEAIENLGTNYRVKYICQFTICRSN